MDKENLFETENEAVEEVVEEITEAVEETADTAEELAEEIEETAEELAEEAGDAAEEVIDSMEETVVYDEEAVFAEPKKPMSAGVKAAIIAVAAIVVIIAVGLAGVIVYSLTANKYNNLGYLDVSGTTAGEVCEESGYDFEQFLEDYSLPADMPKSTTMNAAFAMLPVKTYAAMYYTDFATIKETFGIPDTIEKRPITVWEKIKAIFVKEQVEVNEDTPWGFVMDEISLDKIYGENFADAKEHYGFSDDVTPETPYGKVRQLIEKQDMQERIEADKAAELEEGEEGAEVPEGGETEGDATEGEATVGGADEGTVESEGETTAE